MKSMLLNNKGYLLPMVVIYVIIMLIMGMVILQLGFLERAASLRGSNKEKSFYIAEACIERARFKLSKDSDWSNATPADFSGTLNQGSYTVTFSNRLQDSITIQSLGIYGAGSLVEERNNVSLSLERD